MTRSLAATTGLLDFSSDEWSKVILAAIVTDSVNHDTNVSMVASLEALLGKVRKDETAPVSIGRLTVVNTRN